MEDYQTQYGATPQDIDEYGNPIQQGTTGGFGSATTGTAYGTTTDAPYRGGQQQQERGTGMTGSGYGTTDAPYRGGQQQQERGTGMAGSGYGTTDDPYRGGQQQQERRMMDRGGRRDDDPYSSNAQTGAGMTGTGYGTTDAPYTGGEYEERGMMDKVRDKIPGTGQRDETYPSQMTSTTTPYGGTTGEYQEKKGVMDKIKEKVPGGRH